MHNMIILANASRGSDREALYTAAFDHAGLEWRCQTYEVASTDDALAFINDGDWDAIDVAGAFGAAALPLCTKAETAAQAAGAVNLLVRGEEGVMGFHTAGLASVAYLARQGVFAQHNKAAVCGINATARSIIYALSNAGAQAGALFGPDKDAVVDVAQHTLGGIYAQTYDDGLEYLKEAGIIINTRALDGDDSIPFDVSILHEGQNVLDVNASREEGAFAVAARAQGCRVIDGWPVEALTTAVSLQSIFTARHERGMATGDAFDVMKAVLEAGNTSADVTPGE